MNIGGKVQEIYLAGKVQEALDAGDAFSADFWEEELRVFRAEKEDVHG